MKFKNVLIFFLLSMPFLAMAQQTAVFTPNIKPVIVVDRPSKTSPQLPFDRNFTLQYPLIATDDILRVFVYQVNLERGNRRLKANGTELLKVPCTIDTTKANLNIHVTAIRPNTAIDVLVLRRLTDKQADTLINLAEMRRVTPAAPSPLQQTTLLGIESSYNNFISHLKSNAYTANYPLAKLSYADFIKLYESDLKPKLDLINSYDFKSYPTGTGAAPTFLSLPNISIAELKALDKELLRKEISDDNLLPLAAVVQEGALDNLLNGTIDIDAKYPSASLVNANNYTARISNLAAAVNYFDKLIALLDRAGLANIPLNNNLYENSAKYRSALFASKAKVKTNYVAMVNAIKAKDQLCMEDWIISQNDFTDLVALGKTFVITDLGVTTLALRGHNNWQFYPRPFVAVNFYFRPVDKALKESYFKKGDNGFWRCAALQIGLTYGKLGGSEFSSLFNDFSLLAGVSYRFARWFKVAGGTALTQQTDANPLISSTNTHFGSYVALSFDIDIFSSASQLTGRIFK